ncbi:uncharacterized protein DSM5745_08793 [Aspergillus mulundensis]|uniref:Uncharacterized protein n=1 Tax=Aspergillus mulundensis TaxID=1810919 RepID=A0A3D8R4Q2_9EURO|nr:Uncharacterized protein DSM5745_08793 [Aspergillus mulundensis]RDW69033.1 Uncharacterized protein DSM5745_08793 [Aspergillus mulundensis]
MDSLRSISDSSESLCPGPLCSDFSNYGVSSDDSIYGDPLAQLAKEVKQEPFTTSQNLRKSLEQRHRDLLQDRTRDQYLAFSSVTPAQSHEISDDQSRESKFCRFSFNTETGILVAKVMPSRAHGLAIRSFDFLISLELLAMNVYDDMRPFGSTTVTVGNWTKEADSCWAPASTDTKLSFVVEVGLSESSRRLALDACGWLERHTSVKLVATISLNGETSEITLRQWERVSRSSSPSASCTTSLKIFRTSNTTVITGESSYNGVTTTTNQLQLPFEKIVGHPSRQPLERDLVIPAQKLIVFAEKIWSEQGLLPR